MRVNIDTTGTYTRITASTGDIHGIESGDIHFGPNEVIATLKIASGFRGGADAIFGVMDPNTGRIKDVRSIVFQDGTAFQA